ncbi:MAG: FkbM family methyltransferase [Chthoniobacter sp.]|nr:FkbM family methyltransferase [Chthoniobacter sp.]
MSRLVEWIWTLVRKPQAHTLAGPIAEIEFAPGDIAIDCGANLGDVTVPLAARGATVHAFEPNPHAFRVLQKRTARFPNVHCHNQGVLDRPEKLRLYLHKQAAKNQVKWANGSSLLAFKANVNAGTSVEVEVIDLSAFIMEIAGPIKLLKLDVEGVECPILNKLIDTGCTARIERILVETHDRKIPELREETDALRRRIAEAGLTHIELDWE